ncbi:MAG: hypothetical protein GEU77_17215 [Deltaproteobacteria bacterium]|nr:hypothetical protein [Deltaproteobacteria bacterium]
MASWETDLVMELDRIGEAEVRTRLARGDFGMLGSTKSRAVNKWLASKESERLTAKETRALSISEEATSIAHKAHSIAAEALSHSRRANVIAMIAMICSVIAVISAAIIGFYK